MAAASSSASITTTAADHDRYRIGLAGNFAGEIGQIADNVSGEGLYTVNHRCCKIRAGQVGK